MIHPSIAELTQDGKINRYTLVVATAKCARIITDEYMKQREFAEKMSMNKDNEKAKNLTNLIRKEYRDEKAVKNAINGLYSGEFRILSEEEAIEYRKKKEEEEAQKRAEAEAQAALAKEAEDAEDAEDADESADADADALEMLMGLMGDEDVPEDDSYADDGDDE